MSATTPWTGLAQRARLLFYLQAFSRLALFWVPVTGVGASVAAAFLLPVTTAIGLGAALLLTLLLTAIWFPHLAFERWAYALRDDDLLIARGVLFRAVTSIPLSRIQHVDTRQGPLEQALGLASVQIHTASGLDGDGVIPGLALADAEALRDVLIQVTGDGGV